MYRGPLAKRGNVSAKAVDLTKEHRYDKAKDVYQNNMDGFSSKVQGKALYNMAILHEALGEYDRMLKKAERADGILQSRKSERYLDYAKTRRQDERTERTNEEGRTGQSSRQSIIRNRRAWSVDAVANHVGVWHCYTQVSPSEPTTADVIQVSATNSAGEFVAITDVDWYRDGLLTVENSRTGPNWTSRGQVWDAEVTLEDGSVLMSDAVEIVNSLPEITLTIIPEQPTAGYPVTCDVQIADADDDSVTHVVYWESTEGVRIDNASLSPSESTLGTWTCHVEADDTLDVARESVTVDIIELPDLPNESTICRTILSSVEMVGLSMVVPEYKSARVWFHRMANGWCLGNKMSVY